MPRQLFEQSSRGYEIVSVRLAQAQAYAHLGRWGDALSALHAALDSEHPEGEFEAALEAASLVAWFGPNGMAIDILSKVDRARLPASWALHWRAVDLWLTDPSRDGEHPRGPSRGTAACLRGRCHVSLALVCSSRAIRPRRWCRVRQQHCPSQFDCGGSAITNPAAPSRDPSGPGTGTDFDLAPLGDLAGEPRPTPRCLRFGLGRRPWVTSRMKLLRQSCARPWRRRSDGVIRYAEPSPPGPVKEFSEPAPFLTKSANELTCR